MAETLPNCKNCPSFLSADQGQRVLKKNIGTSFCGRFGIPLGKPNLKPAQEEKLQVLIASTCEGFGQPRPPAPLEMRMKVALPDPKIMERALNGEIDPTAQSRVGSCVSCVNFVRDDIVATEMGWGAGLCRAKGKLIMPTYQSSEARNCEYREFGEQSTTTRDLMLLPEYEEAFNFGSYDPVKAFFNDKKVDPSEYPTDKPVSQEDEESGIRAWRKISDPSGLTTNSVFLPVYNIRDDESADRVPKTGDDEHPENYIDHLGLTYKVAVLWTQLDETPALWGVAGTGKTEFYRYMAWMMCLPFDRISITGSTELEDLAGKMRYEPDKGTYFQYGRLPQAWGQPNVICLDEPNVGPPDVWQFLRPLTDNSKQLVLDMNSGERLSRHTDCYLGLAMNPAWDVRNVGAGVIGDADGSRLSHIFMELPPPILEREILKKACLVDGWEISDRMLSTIMEIAAELRNLCDLQTLPITWGIRPQLKVARASRWFDLVTTYRMSSADYLEPEAQDALLDVVRAHVES